MVERSRYATEVLAQLTGAYHEATRDLWNPVPWPLWELQMRLGWSPGRRHPIDDKALADLRQAGYIFTEDGCEVFRPEVPEPEEPERIVITEDEILAAIEPERIVITEEEILAVIEADQKNAAFKKDFREAMAGVTREDLKKVTPIVDRFRSRLEDLQTRRVDYDVPLGYFDLPPTAPPLTVPKRPSFDDLGMQTAQLWATRSSDSKHKVGACALSNDSHTLVGVGYNGRYPGAPSEERVSTEVGGSEFLHAEQNLLVRARWEHGEKHTLYVSHEPCHECALLILASRHINRVVYASPYAGDGKRRRGSEILKEAGVEVTQWTN